MRKPTGSKFLLKQQLIKVLNEEIPCISSPAEAEFYSAQIARLRQGGVLSDSQYLNFMRMIKDVYDAHGWAYYE